MVLAEPISKQVYTPEEVSQILGLHLNTVYRYLHSKKIPGRQLGRVWLIPANAVMRLVNDGGWNDDGGNILDSAAF